MIGQKITSDKDGNPLDNQGNKLTVSLYQPPQAVKELYAKNQLDYQVAYALQHREFNEFDGYSLLTRARLDQETLGTYVGCEYVAKNKQWRWKGRKNTSRNKLFAILARMIAGMLYPFAHAVNEKNEEDKMTARVARILIEEALRKAGYEMKFMYMLLSALANPCVWVQIEWIEALQRIKQRMADGSINIIEAVDQLLTGLNINIRAIDEVLIADFYSGCGKYIQRQPYMIIVRRISWDEAQKIYKGKHFDENGIDQFDFVQAGKTRVLLTGQENQTLYDIEWTEADRDMVQEMTCLYRDEDLQTVYVGGVFMGDMNDPYNTNSFEHRRLTLIGEEWISIPVYPLAQTGYQPMDPIGRFAYYKSAAANLFWDDAALNQAHRLFFDGMQLDTFKPMFLSGVGKVDTNVMIPSATIGMPMGATATPFNLGPNLAMAYKAFQQQEQDLEDSTKATPINTDGPSANVTAEQTSAVVAQAKMLLSPFALMIGDLIQQVGELTWDCIVMHDTVGDLDTSVPGSLNMKYKTFLIKGKEKGKKVTNKIVFSDENMGKEFTNDEILKKEWALYDKTGKDPKSRAKSDQRIYTVNPYQLARTSLTLWYDADQMVDKSMGADREEKLRAFNILTDPRVAPFTDQKAVVDDFAIEEYGGDDPDHYKAKNVPPSNDMLYSMGMMSSNGQGGPPQQGQRPVNGVQVVPPVQNQFNQH